MENNQNSPDDVSRLGQLAAQFHLELISEVPDEMLDPLLVAELPVEWARTHQMLPVKKGDKFHVLVADPGNINAQKQLQLLLNRELTPLLAARETILNTIERCYFRRKETAGEFIRELRGPAPGSEADRRPANDLLQMAENAPVTQLINLILLEAVKARASDVHIEPYESRLKIRYRIDGLLYEQVSPPKHMELALVSRLKVMAHMDIAERRLPQDGVARVHIGKREIDIRISTVPIAEGERVVLRLLDRGSTLLPLSGLGLGRGLMENFDRLIKEPNGIILVCGPTGSGKTTTLYAALQQLDKTRLNILTIEDPVEYQLADIGQMQVKPKIGLTFAGGLRHILRQDPDVILVGEIRDLETAEIAIRASLTGHIVFSTLHTNDAPSAVTRLTDMGIPPYLCAASLRAAIAQRLVRRLCRACKVRTPLAPEEAAGFGAGAAQLAGKPAWIPKGCHDCRDGFHGRTGLFELMEITPELAETIRAEHANTAALRALGRKQGMKTMLDDGLEKMLAGETSPQEVLRAMGRAG
ncbi:MAG: GspE/PulE family protein [Kiritimatiellae bacterium]|nr:GspE/PulE family protein [Kiritimatiellia bacterium]